MITPRIFATWNTETLAENMDVATQNNNANMHAWCLYYRPYPLMQHHLNFPDYHETVHTLGTWDAVFYQISDKKIKWAHSNVYLDVASMKSANARVVYIYHNTPILQIYSLHYNVYIVYPHTSIHCTVIKQSMKRKYTSCLSWSDIKTYLIPQFRIRLPSPVWIFIVLICAIRLIIGIYNLWTNISETKN